MANINSVAAVIVTFNRLELLKRCINALNVQSILPDKIIIVNNGSTDDTPAWLKTLENKGLYSIIHQSNEGSAGGQHEGIKFAFNQGYSWIWCMDDDGCPEEGALEAMLKFAHSAPCMMNSLVVNINDESKLVFPIEGSLSRDDIKKDRVHGIAHLFNGSLIHKEVVKHIGLPTKELFIWGEESEYFFRVKRSFAVFTVVGSIHFHPANSFSLYKNWNEGHLFKLYYYFRNRLLINISRFSLRFVAYLRYMLFIIALIFIIFFYQTNKFIKIKLLAKSAKDAFRLAKKYSS